VLLSSRKPPTRRVMLNEDEVVQFMHVQLSSVDSFPATGAPLA